MRYAEVNYSATWLVAAFDVPWYAVCDICGLGWAVAVAAIDVLSLQGWKARWWWKSLLYDITTEANDNLICEK